MFNFVETMIFVHVAQQLIAGLDSSTEYPICGVHLFSWIKLLKINMGVTLNYLSCCHKVDSYDPLLAGTQHTFGGV